MPSFEQFARFQKRMPVLIYERVKTSQHLRFFKRYRKKLLFAGNMNVLGILLLGLWGYWLVMGTKYHSALTDAMNGLITSARLDDNMYSVVDWFQKRGLFMVYVTRELRK